VDSPKTECHQQLITGKIRKQGCH